MIIEMIRLNTVLCHTHAFIGGCDLHLLEIEDHVTEECQS